MRPPTQTVQTKELVDVLPAGATSESTKWALVGFTERIDYFAPTDSGE
jgi:hypothetical protein